MSAASPDMSTDRDPGESRLTLRERLQGLMVFRVVLVTLFLGGTIALDVRTLSSLSDPRNATLLGLIILTYLLTIGYAVLLDRVDELGKLAQFQIAADFVLTGVLVLITNALDSVFVFLFYLNIINTAIVVGRTPAISAAGATSLYMGLLGMLTSASISHPLIQLDARPPSVLPVYFEVAVNSVAAFLIALLAGRLSERLGHATDELERKRVDLAQLRALTQNILASLNSGLLTVDTSGKIIYFNAAASAITGLDADNVYGREIEVVFPAIADAIDAIDLEEIDDTVPPGTQPEPANPRFECHYDRPDGETVYLGFSRSILRNSTGESVGHIVVFQDLTEIKRLELEKQRSQRLAAVGELAASIAHEIRNPLASISGSVEMLQQMGDLDDQDQTLMSIVLREVDRLDTLISEFLQYSRPSGLSPEETDLRALIQDVLELFDRGDGHDEGLVDFRVADGPDDWTAEVDKESIRQVLWNLLNNASDVLQQEEVDDPAIRLSLRRDPEDRETDFRIEVEDSGPGVPDAARERIFEPFFTTKEGGSGLGLATSYRLIDEHDGQLQLRDSEDLGGARFVIRLPKHSDEASNPSTDAQTATDIDATSTGAPETPNPQDRVQTS